MAIQKYKGHLALLGAAIMWGLMSPIGKTALENGISPFPRYISNDRRCYLFLDSFYFRS